MSFQVPRVLETFATAQTAMVLLLSVVIRNVKGDSLACQGSVSTVVTAVRQIGIMMPFHVLLHVETKVVTLITLPLDIVQPPLLLRSFRSFFGLGGVSLVKVQLNLLLSITSKIAFITRICSQQTWVCQ